MLLNLFDSSTVDQRTKVGIFVETRAGFVRYFDFSSKLLTELVVDFFLDKNLLGLTQT